MKRAYVLDTSWLCEFYAIPHHHDVDRVQGVQRHMTKQLLLGHELYVPFPVVFELMNHIAHVNDGNVRRKLAEKFADAIRPSATRIFIVRGLSTTESLLIERDLVALCDRLLAEEFVHIGGLTDLSVVTVAAALKADLPARPVHIWALEPWKAHEPDPEPDPLT